MGPNQRFHGCRFSILWAAVLVFGLAACGDKSTPETTTKPVPLAVQPAPAPKMEKDEAKVAAPQPAPAAARESGDTELAEKVRSALGGDSNINVHRIDVTAESGVVTLYGTTDTVEQRAKAAQIAASVSGVKSVHNKLAIVAGS